MLDAVRDRWGETLRREAEAYAREAFDVELDLQPVRPPKLPFFILDRYVLWRGRLLDRTCLFMAVSPGPTDHGPGELIRHRDIVAEQADHEPVVLVFEALSPRLRKRLIVDRVAFMAPGAQLYVPDMLLELRDGRSRKPAVTDAPERFSPTTQMVAIGAMLQQEIDGASATALALRFGVAPMSMSRAFDELQAAGVADFKPRGRQRTIWMKFSGRDLWQQIEHRLQSPVRKARLVRIPYPEHFPALVAGETALALYTDLASPRLQTLAVAATDWNRLVREHGLKMTVSGDDGADEVQTWSYDPKALIQERQVVDRISLYLSVREHEDERVAQAAQQLLETLPW